MGQGYAGSYNVRMEVRETPTRPGEGRREKPACLLVVPTGATVPAALIRALGRYRLDATLVTDGPGALAALGTHSFKVLIMVAPDRLAGYDAMLRAIGRYYPRTAVWRLVETDGGPRLTALLPGGDRQGGDQAGGQSNRRPSYKPIGTSTPAGTEPSGPSSAKTTDPAETIDPARSDGRPAYPPTASENGSTVSNPNNPAASSDAENLSARETQQPTVEAAPVTEEELAMLLGGEAPGRETEAESE